jgi:pimeloyl-ACP methyl ester carboxylesterase
MRSVVPWSGGELAVWEWGPAAAPTIVLSHGWGSRAGRLGALANALVGAGFRVLAYDGPAHGASSGRFASLPEFARALRAVGEAAAPVYGLVGHSLGGAAVALALGDGLPAERVVLIAPPADVRVFSDIFAETLALPRAVQERMHRNLRARLRVDWADLHIPSLVTGLRPSALVIHDRGDLDVPFDHAERIVRAWPGSRLLPTTGLGHRAILRDPAVVRQVVEFMQEGSAG